MTDEPTRIIQPTVHLAEIGVALASIPRKHRKLLGVTLARCGADRGWDEEVRGLCSILSSVIADLDAGISLRETLDSMDALKMNSGTLAWAATVGGDGE